MEAGADRKKLNKIKYETMDLLCIKNFWDSIITGIIANSIFTLILIYVIQQIRYWYFIKSKFHKRTFNTYWKRFPNEIVQTVTCKVNGNKITFSGKSIGSKDSFDGQFILNPINLKYGDGYYFHENSEGFAFTKLIIKDKNTFLVESPYTAIKEDEKKAKIFSRVYQAFIWRITDSNQETEN